MMHPALVKFLIRVMSLHYGIERKQDFFRLVLTELERSFKTREVRLYSANPREDDWRILDRQPPCAAREAATCNGTPKPSETENLKPFVWYSSGGSRLMIPFRHGGNPLMSLQMVWKIEDSPSWISDRRSVEELAQKLGSYLAWENVLLQIAASKRHLQTIFDKVPIPMSVVKENHTIERANRAFSDFFGLPLERVLGRHCFEVTHRRDAPIDECQLIKVQEKGSHMELVLHDGRNIAVTFLPMTTGNGDKKVIHLFSPSQPDDQPSPIEASGSGNRFLRLYDALSQPLTVISLIADLMLIHPENHFNSEYVQMVRGEIDRIISILKEERQELLPFAESRREP